MSMTHATKRRLMIGMLTVVGSLLAVTLYVDKKIAEKDIVNANGGETLEKNR